ncbi:PREDICTED: tetraspanin-31 isoform X2 [Nanorana parkeri]|uniref:tetraspanin-31 isoform X2 n=1 Tax=Nanorana parkeri TaxID=125878 RepID=UPI000854665D|nr:PREDICTED: tetraspanin-31 isoform X2 [Nanorana parkeri]
MVCGGFTCSKNALCALNVVYMEHFLNNTWIHLGNVTRKEMEKNLNCCGLLNTTDSKDFKAEFSSCEAECKMKHSQCETCGDKMLNHAGEALKILGGVGLFFSFTEILGVWLAFRYRNQKDPRANPSAFL